MKRISINNQRTGQWKADVMRSVEFYNDWFLRFAPETYVKERNKAKKKVEAAFKLTNDLTAITKETLAGNPSLLHILRMLTAPPIARDRISGLSFTPKTVVESIEEGKLPKIDKASLGEYLGQLVSVVDRLLDRQLFEWLDNNRKPTPTERERAASVIADRLCGADANPIIRNEQERRQIQALCSYLDALGYEAVSPKTVKDFREMNAGTYCDHLIVLVGDPAGGRQKRIPVDMVVKPRNSESYELPVLIECKSAGDYTNTNKRQKEEAQKMHQLHGTYGSNLQYVLFLCGYFDPSFQGYVAAEGIDWVWEHRIEDFDALFK